MLAGPLDSCSLGMVGGAPQCILFGHFLPSWDWGYLEGQDPIPGGAKGTAASSFPMLGNAFHPFHPTPGQLPPFRLRFERVGGKARLGNVILIIFQGSDTPPPPRAQQRRFCLLPTKVAAPP